MREISPGMEGSPATCSSRLVRGTSKSGENLDSSLISAGEEVMLGHVALILADVHVVELGLVAGLDLDLLGYFAAGIDPVALEGAEDGSEAALLCLEAALQGLDHLPVACRVLEVHVERGRIGGAGFGEASFSAPQLHAALVVRVENPHLFSRFSQKRPWIEPASPRLSFAGEMIRTRRVGGECDGWTGSETVTLGYRFFFVLKLQANESNGRMVNLSTIVALTCGRLTGNHRCVTKYIVYRCGFLM